jgi:hypothetical protein
MIVSDAETQLVALSAIDTLRVQKAHFRRVRFV